MNIPTATETIAKPELTIVEPTKKISVRVSTPEVSKAMIPEIAGDPTMITKTIKPTLTAGPTYRPETITVPTIIPEHITIALTKEPFPTTLPTQTIIITPTPAAITSKVISEALSSECLHKRKKTIYETVTVNAEGIWVDVEVYKEMLVCECGKREDEFDDISDFYLHCLKNDENYCLENVPSGEYYREWKETRAEYTYEREVGWICPDCNEKYYNKQN